MPIAHSLALVPPGPDAPRVVNVIVEIPKGRRSKFEVDKRTGLIRLDRYLYSSLHYPGDYGYIPQTLAEDGDPLDILVMVNEPTFSGCLIEARPIGLFKMTDKGANDYKVLAVPNSDPIFRDFLDLWRVPAHFLKEVEHFFATYKELENPDGGEDLVKTLGWESSDKACHEIQACIRRYNSDSEHTAVKPGSPKRSAKAAKKVVKKAVKKSPAKKASAPRAPKRRVGDK